MKKLLWLSLFSIYIIGKADYLLIPMDYTQTQHLKSYGIAYWVLEHDVDVDWLLNYRGGSFMFIYTPTFEQEIQLRGVSYERISDGKRVEILAYVTSDQVNMDAVKLEVAPKVAVYSPSNKRPWDDAVTLALTYAEIPYDVVYDAEVMDGELTNYDWLHLHHEDFTGQYGKFIPGRTHAPWFREEVKLQEGTARMYGFNKVSELKLAVVKTVHQYVNRGGFLFAMCSASDTYDIALAAEGIDIVHEIFDGDALDTDPDSRLNFTNTLAFYNFTLVTNPYVYEYASIDANTNRRVPMKMDYFTLFEFSAKWDPVPTMLCQNHTRTVKGFLGQTTSFKKEVIKQGVTIMGELKAYNEARYIHGNLGKGMWTFYGGHDPEDYRHTLGEDPTDLSLYPNSPGYRLILNNILFPAARKKKQKT